MKPLDLALRHGAVEGICRRHGADQNQHDQAHALLAVIGAVEKAHQRAGDDENAADPPWRGLIALGLGIQGGIADHELQREQQNCRDQKAEQRREQQRVGDFRRLLPIHPGGAVATSQQRVGNADPDDRADQGVRTRGRKPQIPGPEIPDHRGDQESKDHGEAGAAPDLQDQLDRKKRDDPEGDRSG